MKILFVTLLLLFLLGCEEKPKKRETMDEWIQRLKDEKPVYPCVVTESRPHGDFGTWLIAFKDSRGKEFDLRLYAKELPDDFKFPYEGDTLNKPTASIKMPKTDNWNPNQPSIGDHEVIVQMTLHLEDGRKELITEVWTNGQMMLANYIHEGENLDDHTVRVITDSTRQAEFKAAAKQCRKYLIYKKP